MKKLFVAIVAACLTLTGIADASARPRRIRPDAHSRPSGGMVEKPYGGNVLRVLNSQDAIPAGKVADIVRHMRWATLLPFETVDSRFVGEIRDLSEKAKALVKEAKVGAGVIIIDDKAHPFKIYSEESNWAILNIAFLKEDNPDKRKLEIRFEKMVWRTLARSLQVGSVTHSPSVLQPFRTLAELDANTMMRPSPEGFNAFIDNGKAYGITTITISSYRDACHKGWAPAPTNALQRMIWEQIQAGKERGPTNPITIQPPKAK